MADKFAEDTLLDKILYEDFVLKKDFTKESIEYFAKLNHVFNTFTMGRLETETFTMV